MSGEVGKDPRSSRLLGRRWEAVLEDHVISVAWSPDRGLLAAAAVSGPVTLFSAGLGQVAHRLAGHSFGTTTVVFQPNNPGRLASAGQDGLVKLWDLKAAGADAHKPDAPARESGVALAGASGLSVGPGHTELKLQGGAAWVERLVWSPGGTFLASAAGRKLRLWDGAGQLKREYPAHPSTIADIRWCPGAPELASIAYGQLCVWNPEKPDPVRKFEWSGSMLVLAWSPDGKHIATGDQDATVHLWVIKTGRDLQMAGYQTKVRELAWDQRGRYLATGGGEVVCVWDCSGKGPEGSKPLMLQGHQGLVTAVTYQARGPVLASGGADGRVLLWQPGKSTEAQAHAEFDSGVSQLAWSPDDQQLAVGLESGRVAVLG